MKALLLVGGHGTRLRKVVPALPKPMAEIDGLPFLEYLIRYLKSQSFRDLVLCTGYLGSMIKDYFRDGNTRSVHIGYSHEERPLGTAGAVKLAAQLFPDNDFLVMNGDSLFLIDLQRFVASHLKRNAAVTIALAKAEHAYRFGAVVLGKKGEITAFREKEPLSTGLINGGIYVLNRKVLAHIPPHTKCSLEQEIFPRLVGHGCYGETFSSAYFIDIGVPESYQAIREAPGEFLTRLGFSKKGDQCSSEPRHP